jgi:integrase
VLSITLRSLEPESNIIRVRTKSEGGRGSRSLPASPETFSAIRAYVSFLEDGGIELGPDDPILRKPARLDEPLTRYDVYHRVGAIVPHTGSQKTRRTAATRLSETLAGPADARLIAVRDILGHSSVRTTERYLHYNEDQMVSDFLSATERANHREPPAPSRFYPYDVRERVASLKA